MIKTIIYFNRLPKIHKLILSLLMLLTLNNISGWSISKKIDQKKNNSLLKFKPVNLINNIMINNINTIFFYNFKNKNNVTNINKNLLLLHLNNKIISNKYYFLTENNTLINILIQHGLNINDFYDLLNQYKILHNLKLFQILSWKINKYGQLKKLIWFVSRYEIRIYNRYGFSKLFNEEKYIYNGKFIHKTVHGIITDNFINSIYRFGLTYNESYKLSKVLENQVNLNTLKYGDKFALLYTSNVNYKNNRLLGIHLKTNNKNYYIFRSKNGDFYDIKGNKLKSRFLRYPTFKNIKISSYYNLRRIHPVTGLIRPHKGIDFSMSIGTPVIAVSDGKIVYIKYNDIGGNIIVIRHNNQYITKYMHLWKILVKPNQIVKRGECIALSGNTGRTTGPHLHYELWVNHHPVNPLTTKLPLFDRLFGKKYQTFLNLIKQYKLELQII